jgi:hypothetical protein
MAWVAVDAYSDEYIFQNKPKRDGNWWVDPKAVKLLNKLVTETNAKIVVSSSWRGLKIKLNLELTEI